MNLTFMVQNNPQKNGTNECSREKKSKRRWSSIIRTCVGVFGHTKENHLLLAIVISPNKKNRIKIHTLQYIRPGNLEIVNR